MKFGSHSYTNSAGRLLRIQRMAERQNRGCHTSALMFAIMSESVILPIVHQPDGSGHECHDKGPSEIEYILPTLR